MPKLRESAPKRWLRRLGFSLGSVLGLYATLVIPGCINPSLPTDLALNIQRVDKDPTLKAETSTLVVLQHGLLRSWGSMWRLERALKAHGYDVLNFSYQSTKAFIEDHSQRLAQRLQEHLEKSDHAYERISFVGHSMGGLVIRHYLHANPTERVFACVFLGTPHQGAVRAEIEHEKWWFPLILGEKSAFQLRPGSTFLTELEAEGPLPCERVGVIYGGKGDDEGWNPDIPGDDDRTVGVSEAQLEGQSDSIRIEVGHTGISYKSAPIRQVLYFLRYGRFESSE